MRALVLAAGQGTRLRPLTDRIPKVMVPIAGRPLLEHVVRLLALHGFDELVVNLHHCPEIIREHFGDGSRFGVRITYSYEELLRGTAGALAPVRDLFAGEDFLVYYGDNLTNTDLTDLWNTHHRRGGPVTMGLIWMPDSVGRGIVGLDEDHRINRFAEKPAPDEVFEDYLINGGIYALAPKILDRIPRSGACDFAQDIFPAMLADNEPLFGHHLGGELGSTDTLERYQDTCRRVERGEFLLP
ncbi:MAG: nucleotidyltransferase family protein [Candidatus Latescibacterota bacterium]|nr:nucleotidyltransferase family protein [Candidatus Latescibacterota bacterium]